MPRSFLEKLFSFVVSRATKKALDRVFDKKPPASSGPRADPNPSPIPPTGADRSHPWRLCPGGKYWRRTHPRNVPISAKNPDGKTEVDAHCVSSPSGRETFRPEEFQEIARRHFDSLRGDSKVMPVFNDLGFHENGNRYDLSIAGWTKFWNETFLPEPPLDPDLAKALVASESNFRSWIETPSKGGTARGLIQVTEQTRQILKNRKGELRNAFIDLDKEDLRDPDVNLATGIRWLFHKKGLAEKRLKREVTWEEAIWEYKGITNQIGKNEKADRIVSDIRRDYLVLKKARLDSSL